MRGGTEKNKIPGTAARRLDVYLGGRSLEPDPVGEVDPRRGLIEFGAQGNGSKTGPGEPKQSRFTGRAARTTKT